MKKILILIVILQTCFMFPALAADNLKGFPAAEKGQVRYVLQLPKQDDESVYKVELMVGKTVRVDESNHYFFSGTIEEEVIQGWGFTRYVVSDLGPMAGTLMAIAPNTSMVSRFIKLGGDPYLIRYNSNLPVVIYVPEGTEVRYRIWDTESPSEVMEKG